MISINQEFFKNKLDNKTVIIGSCLGNTESRFTIRKTKNYSSKIKDKQYHNVNSIKLLTVSFVYQRELKLQFSILK